MGSSEDVQLEMAIQWNKSYHENCLVFTNNIHKEMEELTFAGFRLLTRTVNNAINNLGLQKKENKLNG